MILVQRSPPFSARAFVNFDFRLMMLTLFRESLGKIVKYWPPRRRLAWQEEHSHVRSAAPVGGPAVSAAGLVFVDHDPVSLERKGEGTRSVAAASTTRAGAPRLCRTAVCSSAEKGGVSFVCGPLDAADGGVVKTMQRRQAPVVMPRVHVHFAEICRPSFSLHFSGGGGLEDFSRQRGHETRAACLGR